MLAAFAAILICPADTADVSGENRAPKSMQSLSVKTLFSGEFAQDFENFIDDNIGFRSFFTGLSEKLNAKKGIKTPAGRLVYTDTDIGTNVTSKRGFLIVNNSVFEMFMRDKALEEKYIGAVNYYAQRIDESIRLYAAVVPTSLEFEEPMYSNTQDSQRETIDYIYSRLDSRVEAVDMYSGLQKHSSEYIYFRTDHHWTQLGAYYGYEAFAKASGNAPVSKELFEESKIPNFLGSLYTQTSAFELADYPDTIEWYDTNSDNSIDISMRRYNDGEAEIYKSPIFNKTEANYRFFLSGDNPLVELTNKNNPTGKTILIIRDSFANAFAPWIIHNYKKAVLIDPRTCGADFGEILNEFKPDEVLIMNYIFSSSFDGYSELLTGLYSAP